MEGISKIVTAVILLLLSTATFAVDAERTVTIDTREGNRQSFLLLNPAEVQANVILFAGGSGILDIDEYGLGRGETNFLVRSRSRFAHNNLAVAVVDASSAYKSFNDGLSGFRSSESHARDIQSVIEYMRRLNQKPVTVIGTSRGTISAASTAAHLDTNGPDAVVLTASVTGVSSRRPERIFDVPLPKIIAPVLLAHHKRDDCKVTPHSGMKRIKKKLKNAASVVLKSFKGGGDKGGNPCRGLTHHGFYKMEDEVVDFISSWIKSKV